MNYDELRTDASGCTGEGRPVVQAADEGALELLILWIVFCDATL
jgi:hypothetical protein